MSSWPADFATGELLTVVRMNEWPNALRSAYPFPDHPRVRLTPNQVGFGVSGSPVTVTYSAATENTAGMWSDTQSSRITAVVSAPHLFIARVFNVTDPSFGVRLRLRKNGTDITTTAVDYSPAFLLTLVSLTAGDYLELTVESFGGADSVSPGSSEIYVEVL